MNVVELEFGVSIPIPVGTDREVCQPPAFNSCVGQIDVRDPSKDFEGSRSTGRWTPVVSGNDTSEHAVVSVVWNILAGQHVAYQGVAPGKSGCSSAGLLNLSPAKFRLNREASKSNRAFEVQKLCVFDGQFTRVHKRCHPFDGQHAQTGGAKIRILSNEQTLHWY